MNVSTLIENSFKTYKDNFKNVLLLSLPGLGVPMLLLYAFIFWMYSRMLGPLMDMLTKGLTTSPDEFIFRNMFTDMMGIFKSPLFIAVSFVVIAVALAYSLAVYPLVVAAMAKIAAAHRSGIKLSAREAFDEVRKNAGKIIVSSLAAYAVIFGAVIVFYAIMALLFFAAITISGVFVLLIILFFFAFFIAVYFLNILYMFTVQIAANNELSGFQAYAKAYRVMSVKLWLAFGANILTALIIGFITGSISGIFVMLVFIPYGFIITSLALSAAVTVFTPLLIILNGLLYVDLKQILDGYDQAIASNGAPADQV